MSLVKKLNNEIDFYDFNYNMKVETTNTYHLYKIVSKITNNFIYFYYDTNKNYRSNIKEFFNKVRKLYNIVKISEKRYFYKVNDVINLFENRIEKYRNCTIKGENMILDTRTNEKEIEIYELLVKILKNNKMSSSMLSTDLYLLQNGFDYEKMSDKKKMEYESEEL